MVGVQTVWLCWAFSSHADTVNPKFQMVGSRSIFYQAENHFIDHESLPLLGLADC